MNNDQVHGRMYIEEARLKCVDFVLITSDATSVYMQLYTMTKRIQLFHL